MESYCTEQLRTAGEELTGQHEEVKRALMAVQDQTSQDRVVLDQQRAALQDQLESSQQLVHGFLQEELQQDIPTGTRSHPGVKYEVLFDPSRSLTSSVDAFRCYPSASGLCVSQAADEVAEPLRAAGEPEEAAGGAAGRHAGGGGAGRRGG